MTACKMARQQIYDMFYGFRLDALVRSIRHAPAVLFYHGVAVDPDPIVETESISVSDFSKQIEYLEKYYKVISIQEFEQRYCEDSWEGNEILLTFDDGYKNVLHTALPILEKKCFPFVLFLTTNNVSEGELFATTINRLVILGSSIKKLDLASCQIKSTLTKDNRQAVANAISKILKSRPISEVETIIQELSSSISADEMENLRVKYSSVIPMNWGEAKQMSASPLCTVGSHGLDHICCHENQSLQEVSSQINQSRRIIEDKIGVDCVYFSYPNGSYTTQSNKIVAEAGYHLGFSTKRLPVNSLTQWNIPRIFVPYDFSRFVYSLVTYPFCHV